MTDAVLSGGGEDGFSSRRAIAPTMWVLVALSGIELLVVHALVAFWWPGLAAGLSAITLAGLVWLVLMIGSLRTRPSRIEGGRLVMRCGRMREIGIPLAQISGLRTDGLTDADVKAPGVLNLALVAFPNVIVDLDPTVVRRGRPVRAVAHRFDDLPAFTRAVQPVSAAA